MSALPSEITVFESPGSEVHYQLPRRPSAPVRYMGLMPMAVGVFIASWPLIFIAFFLFVAHAAKGPSVLFAVLGPLVIFGPICFPLGGFLMLFGLFSVAGHTEIIVGEGRLRSIDRCGFLRWTRRRSLEKLRGFRVEDSPTGATAANQSSRLSSLKADLANGKSVTVVQGYPREWMLPLARDLAVRCYSLSSPYSTPIPKPIPVVEVSADPSIVRDRDEQPPGSTAIVEPRSGGFTITIPPAGLRRVNKGLLLFCLFWNGFLSVFMPLFLVSAFRGVAKWEGTNQNVSPLFACAFMTPFLLIGIGLALAVIHAGRRRASIAVNGDRLNIVETTVFGTRKREWAARDLVDIRVQSELNQDSEGVYGWTTALHVQPKVGKPHCLLSYRDKAELEWIATLLRQALGLRSRAT